MKRKYPRTYHCPFSPGFTSDDKVLTSMEHFYGKWVLISEKRDGENTTIARDYYHARSLDSKDHESQHYVKKLWSEIRHDIPEGMRICGENLYAKHSIFYNDLESYFEVFSIWIDDRCLSWGETLEWCELLGLTPVPVFYIGEYTDDLIKDLIITLNFDNVEGFVVRLFHNFNYEDFSTSVAKYVRKGHVVTDQHWKSKQIIPNKLGL